jgi:hypothetical protein
MPDPANISVSATLRSGKDVEIRSQHPQDRKDLEAALACLSDESFYRRFFGAKRHFSEKEAGHVLDIDFVNQVALVVVANENGKPAIIGAGRYVVVQPGQAELAFGIVDQYQDSGACFCMSLPASRVRLGTMG